MTEETLWGIVFPRGYDNQNASFPYKHQQNPKNKHIHLQTYEMMSIANEIEHLVNERVREKDCSEEEMLSLFMTETNLLLGLLEVATKALEIRQQEDDAT
jgi:hypothetical protein